LDPNPGILESGDWKRALRSPTGNDTYFEVQVKKEEKEPGRSYDI